MFFYYSLMAVNYLLKLIGKLQESYGVTRVTNVNLDSQWVVGIYAIALQRLQNGFHTYIDLQII